ncbi:MAG: Zn-ribbon domain-containing protein [Methanothrix sp.]|nr:Zn-ribbon domain-containing protein [Methanothrix sp.]
MPHICTRCNNVFESGEDILKGCPVCGWKKFMFARRRPMEDDATRPQPEQIITKAMGVKVPPRAQQKGEPDLSDVDERASEGKKLESIKITAPGTYELNLPSLFERDELIMAVKEGTYFIDLSSAFRKGRKD